MRCLVLALLIVACSSPAAPPPAPPPVVVAAPSADAAPTPPTEPLAAPEAEPVDAAPAPEPLVDPVTLGGKRGEFHCFAWIHGEEFSTDCYRTAAKCETERKAMEAGARPTRPCETIAGASCTMVGRRKMKKEERCFGDPNNCERYRAFVTGNGLDVTACTDR
jgi:hypothetical protein